MGTAGSLGLNAQVVKMPEKAETKVDTTRSVVDSSQMVKGTFQDPVSYSAMDSVIYEFSDIDTTIHMYKEAKVVSIDMEIKAGYIRGSKNDNTLFGIGYLDSIGKPTEKPTFMQGGQTYSMDSVRYNFSSKKARITELRTSQGDGYLRGSVAKKMPDNSLFMRNGQHTTCDNEDCPHFNINLMKAKVVATTKYIYFAGAYLEIEEVPMPIMIPFGFFPQQSDRSSGIRIPTYGEEVARGFFFRNIGYYFAMGQHMDLDIMGDYYTLGSWALRAMSQYNKIYKYNGNFNMEYAFNATGDKGSLDYNAATTFSVRWNHTQSPKARPGTSFSASVNFASANNNAYNNNPTHDAFQSINNSMNSSISYARSWQGSPINFSVNASHSQNMRDSTYSVTFPNLTFSVSRIYPFAKKERVGKKALYEDISLTYGFTFDNRVNFKSTEVSDPNFFNKVTNGLNHNISIGLPSLTLLKHLNFTPTVRYNTKWYFKSIDKQWDGTAVVTDTAAAFSKFGMVHEYGFSSSLSTQIYGIVNFKKGGMVEAIRHVVRPSLSFSYNPDMRTAFNGYRWVQRDTLGNMEQYNIYQGQAYAPPSQMESGSIGFSLGNNLEMKVRNRNDSTGVKKMPLLNTFNLSTSYNLLADSMNLSNFSFSGTTNLPGGTALAFNFIVDPYNLNERGQRINRYAWQDKGLNIGRLTNFGLSFAYSLPVGGRKSDPVRANPNNHEHDHLMPLNPFVYEPFSAPWSLTFNYAYTYSKTYNYANSVLYKNHNHVQTLGISGSVKPTENWDLNIRSGVDLKQFKITTTNIALVRKLHCFQFTFNWVPIGQYQCWSFKIGIISSMLSDILKYDKQNSYFDR